MKALISLSLLALLTSTLEAQVRINEVLFYTDPASQDALRTHQWLELFNAGTDAVDLTGWSVTASDGVNSASARALPPILLPAGAYLVVHFAPGVNNLDFLGNSGDYYTGDSTDVPYWQVDADEAALYSPDTVVDFINWARSSVTYTPGQAYADAVAAGIWTDGAVFLHDQIGSEPFEALRALEPGDSIGRDPDSLDTDSIGDFDVLGGRSSLGPTPGRQNLDMVPIAPVNDSEPSPSQKALSGPRAQPSADPDYTACGGRDGASDRGQWTVLLYMNGDNNLEHIFVRDVFQLQQAMRGTGTDAVRFVVMLDLHGDMPDQAARGQRVTYCGRLLPANAGRTATDPGVNLIDPGLVRIPHQDMGDPATLQEFIRWGIQHYPAEHTGLILASHGQGWKGFGPDESFRGTREDVDALYMGELSTALGSQRFDWIIFNACLMAAIEVAHQLRDNAAYMMASEDVVFMNPRAFPYEQMAKNMIAHPERDAQASIADIFDEYVKRVQPGGEARDDNYTISVIDLSRIADLSKQIGAWADLLAPGMSLFQGRDNPNDNVQILTKQRRKDSATFSKDTNFIDLYDFAQHMKNDKGPNGYTIPTCLLTPVQGILDRIENGQRGAVIRNSHGGGRKNNNKNVHGLHIYFPEWRMVKVKLTAKRLIDAKHAFYPDDFNQPYDLPHTRMTDGNSSFAHYGVNADQLPLKARDPETGADSNLAGNGLSIVWPLPQSPGLLFPNETGWHKVLDRYYHPAADNHILPVTLSDGKVVTPIETGGGACANPIDEITVPWFTKVTFSAKGSSDPDMPSGVSLKYFWDRDADEGCTKNCIKPFDAAAKPDPASNATTDMSADQDRSDKTIDQKDGTGVTFTRVCDKPKIIVTLVPWDDDHEFAFHNTDPIADYVHPQSRLHQAIIKCILFIPRIISIPGFVSTGSQATIVVAVTAGSLPAAAQKVLFTRVTGGIAFVSGTLSDNGNQTTVTTNDTGLASATFLAQSAGPAIIRVDLPGTEATASAALIVQDAALSTPTITSIAPSTFTTSTANQLVTVFGTQFQAGLSVTVTSPLGSATLSGTQVLSLTTNSIQISLPLIVPGTWAITVKNPDGGQSPPSSFQVVAPAISAPTITSTSPATFALGTGNQTVTVFGTQFQNGLTVTVSSPAGTATVSGAQIQSVTPNSFQMILALNVPGTWAIKVKNPDGTESNTFSFQVIAQK